MWISAVCFSRETSKDSTPKVGHVSVCSKDVSEDSGSKLGVRVRLRECEGSEHVEERLNEGTPRRLHTIKLLEDALNSAGAAAAAHGYVELVGV